LRLQKLRESKGLSQAEVARRLGLAKGTVSSYERNIKTPRLDVLIKLAVLYNSSVDYILGLVNRTNLYLDDLSERDQQIVLGTLKALKEELQRSKSG